MIELFCEPEFWLQVGVGTVWSTVIGLLVKAFWPEKPGKDRRPKKFERPKPRPMTIAEANKAFRTEQDWLLEQQFRQLYQQAAMRQQAETQLQHETLRFGTPDQIWNAFIDNKQTGTV